MPDYGPGGSQQELLLYILGQPNGCSVVEARRDVRCMRGLAHVPNAYRMFYKLCRRGLVYWVQPRRAQAKVYHLTPEGVAYCREEWPDLFEDQSESSSSSSGAGS